MNTKFTLIQKLRNKIKLKNLTNLQISKTAKLVDCSIYIKGKNNSLSIGNNTVLRKVNIEIIGDNCSILIGSDCMIGDNCYLAVKEGTKITIGDECGLSRNIKIMTSDGHPIFQDDIRINYAKDINIGKHVWIADNVTILKGVNIDSGCVIGINSMVTKSIPNNCVAVGNPAKIAKENITWKA